MVHDASAPRHVAFPRLDEPGEPDRPSRVFARGRPDVGPALCLPPAASQPLGQFARRTAPTSSCIKFSGVLLSLLVGEGTTAPHDARRNRGGQGSSHATRNYLLVELSSDPERRREELALYERIEGAAGRGWSAGDTEGLRLAAQVLPRGHQVDS